VGINGRVVVFLRGSNVPQGRKYKKARRVPKGEVREALMRAFGAVYLRLRRAHGHTVAEEYLAVMARPAKAKKH